MPAMEKGWQVCAPGDITTAQLETMIRESAGSEVMTARRVHMESGAIEAVVGDDERTMTVASDGLILSQ